MAAKKPGATAGLFYADTLAFIPDAAKPGLASGLRKAETGVHESLLVRHRCRRQLGDVGLLYVVEATAKGDGRGDDRKSNDGAHD